MFDSNDITNVALVIWVVDHVILSVRDHTSILVSVEDSSGHFTHHCLGVVLSNHQGLNGPPGKLHEIKYFGDHG